jgi:2-phosphoglycerate kinase
LLQESDLRGILKYMFYLIVFSEHASEERFQDVRRVTQADVRGEFHERHFSHSVSRRSQSFAPSLQADAKETSCY